MNLNPQQHAAVTHPSDRILCISGAGSGKTRVFVERIRHIIAQGADPRSIIALTFTVAASKVIQDRLGAEIKLGYAGTIHGLLLRQLQQHGHIIGLATRLTVLDEAEAEALLVKVIADMNYKGTRKSVDEAVKKGCSHYRGGGTIIGNETSTVAFEFWHRILTTGCLTFDAILDLGLELVRMLSTTDQLRRFEHILIDESQDSSETDWRIYEALPVKNIFAVGDFSQRIFSFRGSCAGFEQLFNGSPKNGWTALELSDCYRCGSSIVDAANRLISHQPDHPMLPYREKKPMRSATGTAGEITVTGYDTAAEEASAVAAAIKQQLASTPATECAVLCRTNALAASFRATLKACGIPVRERKQTDNPLDWTLARAFIALLTNPESDRLAARFIDLKLGADRAAQMQREAVDDFTTINEKFLHIANVTPQDVTSAMVAAGIGRESVGRVRALVEQLDSGATMLELQGAIAELEEDNAEDTDGVTVCTIHAAKGREWEAVWLPAWEEGVFPSTRESAGEALAEAQRLAYVAVTRAKSMCAISHASRRQFEWKGVVEMTPSRFIQKIYVDSAPPPER